MARALPGPAPCALALARAAAAEPPRATPAERLDPLITLPSLLRNPKPAAPPPPGPPPPAAAAAATAAREAAAKGLRFAAGLLERK